MVRGKQPSAFAKDENVRRLHQRLIKTVRKRSG
jgi:hypothetical protein